MGRAPVRRRVTKPPISQTRMLGSGNETYLKPQGYPGNPCRDQSGPLGLQVSADLDNLSPCLLGVLYTGRGQQGSPTAAQDTHNPIPACAPSALEERTNPHLSLLSNASGASPCLRTKTEAPEWVTMSAWDWI